TGFCHNPGQYWADICCQHLSVFAVTATYPLATSCRRWQWACRYWPCITCAAFTRRVVQRHLPPWSAATRSPTSATATCSIPHCSTLPPACWWHLSLILLSDGAAIPLIWRDDATCRWCDSPSGFMS